MKRIVTLDLLRGYFLCVIAIDHLYRFPNLLEVFTGRGQLWVSAAEGFFMISGLLVGYIYGAKILKKPRETVIKIWKRAGFLYLISVGLTVGFTVWGRYLPNQIIKSGIWTGGNLGEMLWQALTLRYVYGWADFLVYYSVFMAAAPLVVFAAAKKKEWVVGLLSLCLWLGRGQSFYLAWQLLFVISILVGSRLMEIGGKWSLLSREVRNKITKGLILGTAVTVGLSVVVVFGGEFLEDRGWGMGVPQWLQNINETSRVWFDKNSLGPGRVILSGWWFTTLLLIFRKYEGKLQKIGGGVWGIMGSNSLLAYSLQAVLVFPMNAWFPEKFNVWENTGLTVGVLGLIWGIMKIKDQGLGGKFLERSALAEVVAEEETV